MSASGYSLAFVIFAIPYGEEEGEGRGQGGGGRREKEEGRRGGEKRDRQTDRVRKREREILAHAFLSGGKKVHILFSSVQCCFTSGLGREAQDGHLDFHTAPEFWLYPSKQAKIQKRA